MNKTLRWLPRILTIAYILFISLFALDAFSSDVSLFAKIGGFLIHLFPSFLLTAALAVAWKKPLPGGILFLALGVLATLFWNTYRQFLSFIVLSLPMLTSGLLFIVSAFTDKSGSDGLKL